MEPKPFFTKKGAKKLYGIIHDTSNPLNWFERMRQRQMDKPQGLNADIGAIQRSAETRQNIMVARSGQGDQRALGKLAGMNSVEYYKQNSGVLNLSRSDPYLIKKIREANPVAGVVGNTGLVDAEIEAVVEGGAGGGGAEGEGSSVGEAEREAGDDEVGSGSGGGAEGEALAGGGGATATPVVVPAEFAKYEKQMGYLRITTAQQADLDAGMPLNKVVAKHGVVKDAPFNLLLDTAMGDNPSNLLIQHSVARYIKDKLNITIGSKAMFDLLAYQGDGRVLTEAEFKEAEKAFNAKYPDFRNKAPFRITKEDMRKQKERDLEEMKQNLDYVKLHTNALATETLTPFTSPDKDVFRSGLNSLLKSTIDAVKLVHDRMKEQGKEGTIEYPNVIEVRKVSNRDRIGRLFINNLDIEEYVAKYGGGSYTNLTKVSAVLAGLRTHLDNEGGDEVFPLLRSSFNALEEQIDEASKAFREKGKGGRPKGSKNKSSAMVASALPALSSATSPPSVGGATSAATDE